MKLARVRLNRHQLFVLVFVSQILRFPSRAHAEINDTFVNTK
jgi:hypothetical protein